MSLESVMVTPNLQEAEAFEAKEADVATESRRTVIEPTRVIGPLRTARRLDDDELFRPAVVTTAAPETAPETEPVPVPERAEDDTQVLSSVPAAPRLRRRARMPLIVAASVGAGFVLALTLTARIVIPAGEAAPAPASSSQATATATASAQAQAGVLRQGDSGAAVLDLQKRLSRIPDVYPDGKADGKYDSVLAEAVARFQLWYGIRGDEDGEYGDATRRDLEARTSGSTSG